MNPTTKELTPSPPAAAQPTGTLLSALRGLDRLPGLRQFGLIIAMAAALAVAMAAVLWSRQPNYTMLYAQLGDTDTVEVIDALNRHQIDHRIDFGSGAVLVPSTDVQNARLRLAGDGLPRNRTSLQGNELLEQDPGFTMSRRSEDSRHRRATEGELARSIASLTPIQSARVHLAIAESTTFIRSRRPPSASVILQLYRDQQLNQNDVSGIVHLVASSVAGLSTDQVTVVDQSGRLLTQQNDQAQLWYDGSRFELTRRIEQSYVDRIVDILAPLVGSHGIRAQVVATMDFTETERTEETWNPDNKAIRSEQLDQETNAVQTASGIPGSLSNQPPGATAANSSAGAEDAVKRTKSTRNFEVDKSVSHTRFAPGKLERLSVAVVVDHDRQVDSEGAATNEPRSAAEITHFNSLVSQAVGIDPERGDTVVVVSMPFQVPDLLPDAEAPAIWTQPWLWQGLKQAVGPLLALLAFFLILRPTIRRLAAQQDSAYTSEAQALLAGGSLEGEAPTGSSVKQIISGAQGLVAEDPARAAQVVREWVTEPA